MGHGRGVARLPAVERSSTPVGCVSEACRQSDRVRVAVVCAAQTTAAIAMRLAPAAGRGYPDFAARALGTGHRRLASGFGPEPASAGFRPLGPGFSRG